MKKGQKRTKTEEKIIEIIESIRPYINMDGGDLEFIKYEDGYVFVHLSGHCAECDDVGHFLGSIFAGHIFQYLVSSVVVEVDVDIGQRYSVGVEKSLKQQIEPQRVDIRYAHAVRAQASRAATAPRTYGDILRFRIPHEIPYNQKIVHISHALYGLKLIL